MRGVALTTALGRDDERGEQQPPGRRAGRDATDRAAARRSLSASSCLGRLAAGFLRRASSPAPPSERASWRGLLGDGLLRGRSLRCRLALRDGLAGFAAGLAGFARAWGLRDGLGGLRAGLGAAAGAGLPGLATFGRRLAQTGALGAAFGARWASGPSRRRAWRRACP